MTDSNDSIENFVDGYTPDETTDDVIITDDSGRDLYEHFRFVADKGQALLRVDKFLTERLQKSSRNRVQQAADAGCILVNGKPVKSNYRVKPLDVVQVVMDRPRYDFEIIAQDIPLDIVYEDDFLLVVNKPPGLVVHPGHGNYSGTLVNALAWHFKDNPDYDVADPRMGLVHRIDKDTSGLLVVAKTPDAKTHLGKQFFNKTTKREYVAVVWGRPDPADGRIEGNIGRSLRDRLQMDVFPAGDYGKHAVTHYHTIEPLGPVTVVKCVLETGRTHQIRVHMRHIGHPLFNDARYGGDKILRGVPSATYKAFVEKNFQICPRQALHARTLGFVHPETGEEMFFSCPVPDDMTAMIDRWRQLAKANESK
ncbi:MAG: RluA family pseudouridine synthase [Muribaculaceae bacterium]|nr:RluA family pseudouridine synthase [Muribaculaceae bacterium]